MGYEETLASVPLFSHLDEAALERLSKAAVSRKHGKGEVIVKEGEQAVAFFVIVKGRVAIMKGEQQLAELKAGDFFGEMALLDGYPRATSVVAVDDTECLAMTRWDFTAELRSNPEIGFSMLPVLSRRIRELEERNRELEALLRESGG
jgi:CRP-like cAMP-binding protein